MNTSRQTGPALAVYSRKISGYADGYLLRQRDALPQAKLLIATEMLPRPNLGRRARTRILRKVGANASGTPFKYSHLRELAIQYDTIYTMFFWNGADVCRALTRSSSETRIVVHAGGSDVMRAAQLADQRRTGRALKDAQVCLERADLILCGSDFLRETLVSRLIAPTERLQTHYIGVNCDVQVPDRPNDRAPLIALSVSRLEKVKGVDLSIRAAVSAVRDHGADLVLRVAGSGSEERALKELVVELKAQHIVTFLGELSHDQVFDEMASADMFVQHNVRGELGEEEALGGSILEASVHALPVVATASGGVPEAVVHGVTGLIGAPGDWSETAEHLAALTANSAKRKSLGDAGRRFVLDRHNARKQDELLRQILEAL